MGRRIFVAGFATLLCLGMSGCLALLQLGSMIGSASREQDERRQRVAELVSQHNDVLRLGLPTDPQTWMQAFYQLAGLASEARRALAEQRQAPGAKPQRDRPLVELQTRLDLSCRAYLSATLARDNDPQIELTLLPRALVMAAGLNIVPGDSPLGTKERVAELMQRKSRYWADYLKQVGGIRNAVRRAGKGRCYFTSAPTNPQRLDVEPLQYSFTKDDAEIYARCILPAPLRTYGGKHHLLSLQLAALHHEGDSKQSGSFITEQVEWAGLHDFYVDLPDEDFVDLQVPPELILGELAKRNQTPDSRGPWVLLQLVYYTPSPTARAGWQAVAAGELAFLHR